ncbi:TetR/AcrR family transcriptional regulator [Aquabacterium sp.]|uniref:TetR/AcrR family transcriptional regulator n=1 Tax=Aquabacterium sp. TaxID=1872578 RepID=UPI0019AA3669|nr:TetR/AcrR family transcriptional regulator [Aquabacterium sp.]MBC7699361.1 TetR/AcrR family transcriptional regulator [Aquabacterium sp.]
MNARQKLIDTTARLLQTAGYHHTGLNQIVAESGAPKGSLYHYFPGGKVALAVAALEQSASQLAQGLAQLCMPHADAESAVSAVIDFFIQELESSNYTKGCPVATTTLEQAALTPEIRDACARAYRLWQGGLEAYFSGHGMGANQATFLAEHLLMLIEGALLLARAQHSCDPLRRLKTHLPTLIQSSKGVF